MVPQLRKRKAVEAPKPNGAAPKKVAKSNSPSKRKAAEESSPVSLKKQKGANKAAIEKKSSKPEPKSKPKEEEETLKVKSDGYLDEDKEVEKTLRLLAREGESDEDSESNEQAEESLQTLAGEVDPEEEEETTEEVFKPGQDVGKIPKIAKDAHKAAKGTGEGPGIIYLGRIPHGFYEYEMKQYLSQFGPILRLRLSRSKKTGRSKHFAFIEFKDASTAEIVAKTMDNYLLFGHILKCKVVHQDQVHESLWKGANRRFKAVPWNAMEGKKLEKPLTEAAWAHKIAKERKNRSKKASKLREIGYEFEAPTLNAAPKPAPIAIENGEETKAIEAAPEEAKVEEATEETSAPEAEPEPEPEVKKAEPTKKAPKAKAAKASKSKKAKA